MFQEIIRISISLKKNEILWMGIVTILFISGLCNVPSFSQTSQQFSVSTDKPLYHIGETIIVSGNVNQVISNTPLTIQILDPSNHSVYVDQITPSQDGSFHTKIITDGPLWTNPGTYSITAQYGQNGGGMTTFTFNTENLTSHHIPEWIKNIFIWYGQDKISEDDLLGAIKFLVDNGIIQLQSK